MSSRQEQKRESFGNIAIQETSGAVQSEVQNAVQNVVLTGAAELCQNHQEAAIGFGIIAGAMALGGWLFGTKKKNASGMHPASYGKRSASYGKRSALPKKY